MLQDFFRIIQLLVASLVLSIFVNSFHPMGLPIWKQDVPGMPIWIAKRLQTIDSQTAFRKKEGILVDARNKKDYQKEHIQGAINLPYYGFSDHYPEFSKKVSKEEHLFIYCYHSGCPLENWVAKRLLTHGFSNLTLIEEGFEGWKRACLPTTK